MKNAEKNVRKEVIKHYRMIVQRSSKYAPVKMAELAPGVVAVKDISGECDTLFDTDEWRFTHPEIWDSENLLPSLKKVGIGVLEGLGQTPRVSSIEEMV